MTLSSSKRWLVALGAALVLVSAVARGATSQVVVVTLANGEKYEGMLLDEDEDTVVLETSQAGGTIIQTREFARTNITALTPLSPEELRRRQAAAAYAVIQRYQLHPVMSYQLAYYDQVIDTVFRPFLERYPDEPEAAAVAQQLAAWRTERDRVAQGQARYEGEWMPAADAARLLAERQADRLHAEARAALGRRQFERALRTLGSLQTPEARSLRTEICGRWIEQIDQQHEELQNRLGAQQARLDKAQQNLAAAQRGSKAANTLKGTHTDGRLGSSQRPIVALMRAQNEARRAAAEVAATQQQLDKLTTSRRLAVAQARMAGLNVPSEPTTNQQAETTARAPAPPEDFSSPSILGAIAEFGRKYWPLAALVFLVILYLIGRAFGR